MANRFSVTSHDPDGVTKRTGLDADAARKLS
jgi:hypothetical protein